MKNNYSHYMNCVRKVTDDVYWVGGNDRRLNLFENIFPIPRGVSYNSYIILDEKTCVVDSVDWSIARDYMENVIETLNGRNLDYLIVNHMEPDHCSAIEMMVQRYPDCVIVSTEQGFEIMRQFRYRIDEDKIIVVKEGDTLSIGKHNLFFVEAPMVHWPEVMMTYDTTNGVLFSADAFGSFGAIDGALFNDEVNFDRDWLDDARRYYCNIVGKYGPHVQDVLKKAGTIDIKYICPLHGLVWRNNFGYILDKYNRWSSYVPEDNGVIIVYSSMYGNTEHAAQVAATMLHERGVHNVRVYDVSCTHVSTLIAETFRVSHVILGAVTYNLGIYPVMHNYLQDMKVLNVQNRTFAIMENGTWACKSGDLIEEFLSDMKTIDVMGDRVTMNSALSEGNQNDLVSMIDSIVEDLKKAEQKK